MNDHPSPTRPAKARQIKCVVWDLDHTLWSGVLLEDPQVELRAEARAMILALDERGILQSIASRNDAARALAELERLGLAEYFLHPQIHWGAKSGSVRTIAERLNLGLDALAFIDDQPFERDEVRSELPEVQCHDPAELPALLDRPEFCPRFITEDSRRRRAMVREDLARAADEERFDGPKEAFLAGLEMVFTISRASEADLRRAEELTLRTNQLNTTGYTYSHDELDHLRRSDRHLLLIAGLDDRYGSYGKIGLALVELGDAAWTVKLLLMSCRVMSRGVGTVLMHHLMRRAQAAGVRLLAEFVPNDRNRMMYVTYKFGGFREVERRGEVHLLEHDLVGVPPPPTSLTIHTED
ncbi:MAG: HAD-IIIC family phosphatase [Nannocystaceae bacterium]